MSEQTPPSDQPNPPAANDAEAPAEEGAAPPPPPPAETTPETVAAPPPPPPPAKKSRTGLIVAVAVVLVLALVGGGVAVIFALSGKDSHSIAIPATAGGMKRDKGKESQLKQQLNAAEQQFKTQAKNVSYVKSGVYNQDDKKRGPQGALVFLGAKLKTDQSPKKFVDAFGKQAGSNGFKIDKVSAGDGGGEAVCASQSTGQKVAICAWATKDSMGELVPTVPGWESDTLAKILLDLRKDVEKTG